MHETFGGRHELGITLGITFGGWAGRKRLAWRIGAFGSADSGRLVEDCWPIFLSSSVDRFAQEVARVVGRRLLQAMEHHLVAQRRALECLQATQRSSARLYNKRRLRVVYREGDIVLVRHGRRDETEPFGIATRWSKLPGRIKQQLYPNVFLVRHNGEDKIVNIEDLRLVTPEFAAHAGRRDVQRLVEQQQRLKQAHAQFEREQQTEPLLCRRSTQKMKGRMPGSSGATRRGRQFVISLCVRVFGHGRGFWPRPEGRGIGGQQCENSLCSLLVKARCRAGRHGRLL